MDRGKENPAHESAPIPGDEGAPVDEAEKARREALKRLGILAAYTAPAMMVLLSNKVQAQATTSGVTN